MRVNYLCCFHILVFKSLSNIDKSVESCDINLNEEDCRLVFQLKCRHGIVKTHQLTFQECESLQASFAFHRSCLYYSFLDFDAEISDRFCNCVLSGCFLRTYES